MKTQIIYIPFVLFLMASCYSGQGTAESENKEHSLHKTDHPGRDSGNLKWQLDESTRKNISAIKLILAGSPDTTGIRKAGLEISDAVDQLIRECRMKGADHDALHSWLEGFNHDLKKLNNSEIDPGKRMVKIAGAYQTV
jgi:hypothetical protein